MSLAERHAPGDLEDDELLPISYVVAHINVNERTVRRWIKAGKLTAIWITPRTVRITRSSYRALRTQKKHDSY